MVIVLTYVDYVVLVNGSHNYLKSFFSQYEKMVKKVGLK